MNYIEVEMEALVVAHDEKKYVEMTEAAVNAAMRGASDWATYGVSNHELMKFAGGNDNLIISVAVDNSVAMRSSSYGNKNGAFTYNVSRLVKAKVICCTRDGRKFTDDEARKLTTISKAHLEHFARAIGALYAKIRRVTLDPGTESLALFTNSAAETCEISREEVEQRRRQKEANWKDFKLMLDKSLGIRPD